MPAAPEPAPGAPEIVRIVAPNPGPLTLAGTNTYLVGRDPAWVIDPGPDDPAHLQAILAEGERRGGIAATLITHGHGDHNAGAAGLGVEVIWGSPTPVEETRGLLEALADPTIVAAPGSFTPPPSEAGPFSVVPTPGHAADHVVFVLGDVCFCGDLVLGEGSAIVPPLAAGGSLADYMRSLERVEALGARLLAPGHGPWIGDPAAKLRAYREHRLARERDLLTALERGERSRERLLDAAWSDVPEPMRPMAALAMRAHLERLAADGVDLTGLGD